MKTHCESGDIAHIFLISVLDGGEWSASHNIHWIGGWVGLRTTLKKYERKWYSKLENNTCFKCT